MTKSNDKMPASELEALLPWHAAGTLDSREADEIEQALAADKELARRFALVREEMTETILLNEALGAPSARVMENLFKAIDKERKVARGAAAAGGLTSGFTAWLADLMSPRAFAFAGAAAAIVILLQAGYIVRSVLEDRGGGTFETASAPTAPGEIGSYALVRFSPQATMGDITRFLDTHSAVIVDGPRPGGTGGMYKVRVAGTALSKDDLDRLVKELQASGGLVVFAAPTE
jgi:hypothetical protein